MVALSSHLNRFGFCVGCMCIVCLCCYLCCYFIFMFVFVCVVFVLPIINETIYFQTIP